MADDESLKKDLNYIANIKNKEGRTDILVLSAYEIVAISSKIAQISSKRKTKMSVRPYFFKGDLCN